MKLTLNIGLENNPLLDAENVHYMVNVLFDSVGGQNKTVIGEYNGKEEKTAVIAIDLKENQDITFIRRKIQILAMAMTQECIAYKLGDDGFIAFTYLYSSSERLIEFNQDYFIEV